MDAEIDEAWYDGEKPPAVHDLDADFDNAFVSAAMEERQQSANTVHEPTQQEADAAWNADPDKPASKGSDGSTILANAEAMAKKYPRTKHGKFGKLGKNVRVIESATPEETSVDFFNQLTKGGTMEPIFDGKVTRFRLNDGTRITHRFISKSGGPVVEILISGSPYVPNQKIHFILKEN